MGGSVGSILNKNPLPSQDVFEVPHITIMRGIWDQHVGIVSLNMALGYLVIRSPYTPYSIYLRGALGI